MGPGKEATAPRRRESRAGTRKVTTLSAEQLERKRANDREAQRTIRQRTKEHIDRLQREVQELKAKGEQYDHLFQHNMELQEEISLLKSQLSMKQTYSDYSETEVPRSRQTSVASSVLPASHAPAPFSEIAISQAPSDVSSSSRASVSHDWPYPSTRPPSTGELPETDYPREGKPYLLDRQTQPAQGPHTTSTAYLGGASQYGYSAPGDGVRLAAPSIHPYPPPPHHYPPVSASQAQGEPLLPHLQHPVAYHSGHRSMSVPTISMERKQDGRPLAQTLPPFTAPNHVGHVPVTPPYPPYSWTSQA
ncbi:hypothetical protein ASPZODRAFT_68521 [Penicilliopsis zonata CBS 506.65]|uniref:BZIP domain-containing protein n=1 Tax=Penicilliopsis zonata CBS 506.65 TaxID=1073090 RepID=A0A1L9SEF0_9EURO|nr:hypothetical protein ASPZODRAFT_68521 [Penicilliopsis zonata CBS 506.65]OJJ45600.1 hypothetical protein ASPZODRAFT_68521 [Penicilliopsis zonata CBS 506.65]